MGNNHRDRTARKFKMVECISLNLVDAFTFNKAKALLLNACNFDPFKCP